MVNQTAAVHLVDGIRNIDGINSAEWVPVYAFTNKPAQLGGTSIAAHMTAYVDDGTVAEIQVICVSGGTSATATVEPGLASTVEFAPIDAPNEEALILFRGRVISGPGSVYITDAGALSGDTPVETPYVPPVISVDFPATVGAIEGDRLILNATAIGNNLTFTLYQNGFIQGSGTSPVVIWTIDPVIPGFDGNTYRIDFTDDLGTTVSTTTTTLTVTPPVAVDAGVTVSAVAAGALGPAGGGGGAAVTTEAQNFSLGETMVLGIAGHVGTVIAIVTDRGPAQDVNRPSLPGWHLAGTYEGSQHNPGMAAWMLHTDGTQPDFSFVANDAGAVSVLKDPRTLDFASSLFSATPGVGNTQRVNVPTAAALGVAVVATNAPISPIPPPELAGLHPAAISDAWPTFVPTALPGSYLTAASGDLQAVVNTAVTGDTILVSGHHAGLIDVPAGLDLDILGDGTASIEQIRLNTWSGILESIRFVRDTPVDDTTYEAIELFQGSAAFAIRNCEITGAGYNGGICLDRRYENSNGLIEHNEIHHIAHQGLMIHGTGIEVRYNQVHNLTGDLPAGLTFRDRDGCNFAGTNLHFHHNMFWSIHDTGGTHSDVFQSYKTLKLDGTTVWPVNNVVIEDNVCWDISRQFVIVENNDTTRFVDGVGVYRNYFQSVSQTGNAFNFKGTQNVTVDDNQIVIGHPGAFQVMYLESPNGLDNLNLVVTDNTVSLESASTNFIEPLASAPGIVDTPNTVGVNIISPPAAWATLESAAWYSGHTLYWRAGSGGFITAGITGEPQWTLGSFAAFEQGAAVDITTVWGQWVPVIGAVAGGGPGANVNVASTQGVYVPYTLTGDLEMYADGVFTLNGQTLTALDVDLRADLGGTVPTDEGYVVYAQLETVAGVLLSAKTLIGSYLPGDASPIRKGQLAITAAIDPTSRLRIFLEQDTRANIEGVVEPPPPPPPPPPPAGRLSRSRRVELFRSQGGGGIPTLTTADRYVDSTNGSDANNGLTPGTAWATTNHAVNQVGNAGLGIGYMTGSYPGILLQSNASGTNWLNRVNTHYVLEGHTATIHGNFGNVPAIWLKGCAYVGVSGFEVQNTNYNEGNEDWPSGCLVDDVDQTGDTHHLSVTDMKASFFSGSGAGGYGRFLRFLGCEFYDSGHYHLGGGSNFSTVYQNGAGPNNSDFTPAGYIDNKPIDVWVEGCYAEGSRQKVTSSLIGFPNTLTDGNNYIIDIQVKNKTCNIAFINCIGVGAGGKGFTSFEGATDAWFIGCLAVENGKHIFQTQTPGDPVFGKDGHDQSEFMIHSYTRYDEFGNVNEATSGPLINVHWWNCVAKPGSWHNTAFTTRGGRIGSIDAKNNVRVGGNDPYSTPIGSLSVVNEGSGSNEFDGRLLPGSPLATGGDPTLFARAGVTVDFSGEPLNGSTHVGPYKP